MQNVCKWMQISMQKGWFQSHFADSLFAVLTRFPCKNAGFQGGRENLTYNEREASKNEEEGQDNANIEQDDLMLPWRKPTW